jgi:hypothetical protein
MHKMYRIKANFGPITPDNVDGYQDMLDLLENFFILQGDESAKFTAKACFKEGAVTLLTQNSFERLSNDPKLTLTFEPQEQVWYVEATIKELEEEIKELRRTLTITWEDVIAKREKEINDEEKKLWDTGKPRVRK